MDDNSTKHGALPDPLSLIASVFAAASAASPSGYDPAWVDAVPARVLAALGASPQAVLERVPLLTRAAFQRGSLPRGSLVRYVGMVQDVFDPEWYAAAVVVGGASQPCAFRDALPTPAGADVDVLEGAMERRCVVGWSGVVR